MTPRHPTSEVHYTIEDGCLVRAVVPHPAPGRQRPGYEHRCPLAAYEAVAHAIEETPAQGNGTTMREIAEKERLPATQVHVALEFLKERGVAEVRHRRCYPATDSVHIDAMVEWHALAAGG